MKGVINTFMGIYQNIFDLIHQYIYGGVELTADMNLVTTLIATAGCIFIIAIPFLLVWKVIEFINGGWR